ncbi:integral membrane protein GPR137C isoform X1 [Aquarana catesbeiana]|uniref:integral membrane protein GPR137C isoform X1 n=1 Tax=Aquarana catesbeiana TaxID=8400 RepID=UPI003CCA4DFB
MTDADIPWTVVLGLTATVTGLCLLLFLYIYGHLWLLLYYRQKRASYQSALLSLCLLWAGCRTVLFSFYLNNCARDNELYPFPYWLLYYAPICLQFFTLCLLHLYFFQVIFKARCTPEFNRYKMPLRIVFCIIGLIFLIVNLLCIWIGNGTDDQRRWIPMTRITISNCLFAACSISLASNTYKIANMTPAHVYLESKGTSGNQAVMTGSLISTLYILRAMYNLVVFFSQSESEPTPFSYGWNGVSDHAFTENNDMEYMIFTLILLFCEFLPMCLMTYFFRAKKTSQNLEAAGMVNSHSFGSRAYFFDNPRRYDSDEDLPRLAGARGERGSLPSTPRASGWYGTICPTSGCALAPPLLSEPSSGTPVLFTFGANTLA